MSNDAAEPLLDIRGLTKRFIGTLALDRVDFAVRRGEIHALIGENGAGKSTLIKALAGLFPPDGGEIRFAGAARHPHAEHLPISFVHQDLGLVDDLSVGENVALVAGYPRTAGLIDWRRVWSRTRDIYRAMDVDPPDPRGRAGALDAAGRAVLGIVRALAHRAEILVLDEPTASLPEPDARHLFAVLRDGRRVRSAAIAEVTPDSLVADMLGRQVAFGQRDEARPRGTPVLEVSGLCAARQGPLSFAVDGGEIVALVGLRGAGQETIGRALFGAIRAHAGQVRLHGRTLPPGDGIAERVAAGVALLPGDRVRESAVSGLSLRENLFPNPGITHAGALQPYAPASERARAQALLRRFDVRPASTEAMIDWLSGGNQQKVFVARWLESGAPLLILEEPTAGVDIGAKLAIHRMVRDAAATGAAVLVVSSDFEEVAALCHRALVVARGRIVDELRGAEVTVDGLLARSSTGAAAA